MTAASTTSFTVPPNATRITLTSSSETCVRAQRRRGPIGPVSDDAPRRVGATDAGEADGDLARAAGRGHRVPQRVDSVRVRRP